MHDSGAEGVSAGSASACVARQALRPIRLRPQWSCPHPFPVLRCGETHVWILPRRNRPSDAAHPLSVPEMPTMRWVHSTECVPDESEHAVLRILAGYLRRSPDDVSIRKSRSGKPRCFPFDRASRLHMSISHSGSWTLLAVRNGSPLGLDWEKVRRPVRAQGLPQHLLGNVHRHSSPLPPFSEEVKTRLFIRDWTLMEALLKLLGRGLLDAISAYRKNRPLHAVPPATSAYMCRFGIGPHHLACLALIRRPCGIRFFLHPCCCGAG